MIIFKTTEKLNFPTGRTIVNDFIYLRVLMPVLGRYKIVPKGYYFFLDADGVENVLGNFSAELMWSDVAAIENTLQPLDGIGIYDAMLLRLEEMTMKRIEQEYQENNEANWGVNPNNLEKINNQT